MRDDRAVMEAFLASIERRAFLMAKIATGDVDDAMDIVQDAMFALVKKYRRKPEHLWKPLFYKILQNRIRDWYRRSGVRSRWHVWLRDKQTDDGCRDGDPLDNMADPRGEDPSRQTMRGEASKAIMASLTKLPWRQQQAFLLRAWEGLSVSETAMAMQCSQGSVKTHYSRAIRAMRNRLKDHWP